MHLVEGLRCKESNQRKIKTGTIAARSRRGSLLSFGTTAALTAAFYLSYYKGVVYRSRLAFRHCKEQSNLLLQYVSSLPLLSICHFLCLDTKKVIKVKSRRER